MTDEFDEMEDNTSEGKRRRTRYLRQYKKLTDDEYNDLMDKRELNLAPIKIFEDRIERKLKQYGEDYDLTDMKFNDRETLRALVQAQINLEDIEQISFRLRGEGITYDNLTLIDKLNQQMSALRKDISIMQSDLKISRKIRKSDKEESVINFVEDLKAKAKIFYDQKMYYVFCPKCNMLVATVWFLWPDVQNNMKFYCKRLMDDGTTCSTRFEISSKTLMERKTSNKPELLPESML